MRWRLGAMVRVVGVAAAAAMACGGGGGGGGGGNAGGGGGDGDVFSCTLAEATPIGNLSLCEELMGVPSTTGSMLAMACMLPAGAGSLADAGVTATEQFRRGACSHVNALGGCRDAIGCVTITFWYYRSNTPADMTPEDIQSLCTSAGSAYVAP